MLGNGLAEAPRSSLREARRPLVIEHPSRPYHDVEHGAIINGPEGDVAWATAHDILDSPCERLAPSSSPAAAARGSPALSAWSARTARIDSTDLASGSTRGIRLICDFLIPCASAISVPEGVLSRFTRSFKIPSLTSSGVASDRGLAARRHPNSPSVRDREQWLQRWSSRARSRVPAGLVRRIPTGMSARACASDGSCSG